MPFFPFTLLLVEAAAANDALASGWVEVDYFWLCALVVELTELRVNVIFLALFLGS